MILYDKYYHYPFIIPAYIEFIFILYIFTIQYYVPALLKCAPDCLLEIIEELTDGSLSQGLEFI